jgi:predicted KAP-like P-loop ATPase
MFNENIQDEEQRSLEETRAELADDLRALPKPVLVVIDDIDRITRDETRLLFQHVKANADFPNLVYLLLYHEELVAKHLEEPSLSGKAFLEKIVQLPLHMPAIPLARVQKVLFSSLDQIIESQQNVHFDQRRWGNLFLGALSAFFSNLRDVNRFLSTFSVHVGLFQSPRAFEVNIIDLIVIETIRLFEPPAYERIAASKELLTSGVPRERGDGIPTAIQAIADAATEPHRGAILELLKQLFPPIEAAFGGASYSGDFRQVWLDELRVCSGEVFDRYFQLGVPEGDLSESEFRELVEISGDANHFVQKFEDIRSRDLLDVVLARLDAYGPRLDLARVRPLLTALLRIGEDLPETRGMFGLGGELHVMRIIIRYLGQEPVIRTRGEMFLQALQDSEQIVIPAWVISNEDSIRQNQSRRGTESILEDDQLALAKATWSDKILHVCRYNPEWFLRSPQLVFLLYRWREWVQEIGPATILPELINSRERAIDFITSIAQTSTVHRSGDYVSENRKFIRLASVEDFIALNALLALVDPASLNVAELNTQQVAALQALREAVQRREEGKSDDHVS